MAGYNSRCYYQTCAYNCCNRNGDCPETYPSYYTSYYTDCYYYYSNTASSATGGAIAGYVISGIFVLVFVIIAVVCYMRRKNQQAALEQAQQSQAQPSTIYVGQQDPSLNTLGYNQPAYGQPDPYAQPYGQAYGQPQPYAQPYVQPAQPYAQPYVQPYPQQAYPQQQGPIIIHKT